MERITDYLRADHARLHVDLDAARGEPFDGAAYDRFRRGLLRHIAIEEKLLFPAARAALGDDARRLKIEHAAIGTLLVPTPDRVLADELAALLSIHDAREEVDGGVYARCEAALDAAASRDLAARAQAFPEIRASRYVDRPGARRTVRDALAAAERMSLGKILALAIAILAAGAGCKRDCPPAPAPASGSAAAPVATNAVQHEMQLLNAAMQATMNGVAYGDVRGVPAAFEEVDRAKQATEAALESGAYKPARNADQLAHFRELDEAFHPQLEKILEAAGKNDVPATAQALGAAMQGCQPCHGEFRK